MHLLTENWLNKNIPVATNIFSLFSAKRQQQKQLDIEYVAIKKIGSALAS